jgi:ATPase subunit of ABC transporter with duplicated ATPase domains
MQPMYTLSGGQKGRVAFAKVCASHLREWAGIMLLT